MLGSHLIFSIFFNKAKEFISDDIISWDNVQNTYLSQFDRVIKKFTNV